MNTHFFGSTTHDNDLLLLCEAIFLASQFCECEEKTA